MTLRRKFTGAKHTTEAADQETDGRGAFCSQRSQTGRTGGACRSENVGISSEKDGENPSHRKPKVS